jgi:hypothetical protein
MFALSPAHGTQSIESKHCALFHTWNQATQNADWQLLSIPKVPNSFRGSTGTDCDYSLFPDSLTSGIATYRLRTEPETLTYGNDSLILHFNPSQANYTHLLNDIIPHVLKSFSPWYLELGDETFLIPEIQADGSIQVGGTRACGGKLFPVFFMSEEYLRLNYGLTTKMVVSKLESEVESVHEISGGVYVIGSSQILTFEKALLLTQKMEKLMRKDSLWTRLFG